MARCKLIVAERCACSVLDMASKWGVSDVGKEDGAVGCCPVEFLRGVVEIVDDAVTVGIDEDTRADDGSGGDALAASSLRLNWRRG